MKEIVFLKLGGSLITDKDRPHTALEERIDAIADQIAKYLEKEDHKKILLGHGSGSFGHVAAKKYDTRAGVTTESRWLGFAEVWYEARVLNQIVVERFHSRGLPVISFPISSSAYAKNSMISKWTVEPIQTALAKNLLPVIYGDVVFDSILGGTILSTEEQFTFLSSIIKPTQILLAGREKGIWEDFPTCTRLVEKITLKTYPSIRQKLFASSSTDVTGGMSSKVENMIQLVRNNPSLQVKIFSGLETDAIYKALSGEEIGTTISSS